jgi:hypothetical protein
VPAVAPQTDSASLTLSTESDGSSTLWVVMGVNHIGKWFKLDTGTDVTTIILDEQTAKFPSLGKKSVMESSGLETHCDLVAPEKLILGDIVWINPSVYRCAVEFNRLGLDLLTERIFSLDFQLNRISFLKNFPSGQPILPLRKLSAGHILLPTEFAGRKLEALFDTGASYTTVDSRFIELHPKEFESLPLTDVVNDASGNALSIKLYRLKRWKIGSLVLKDEKVYAMDFPPDMREYLGTDTPMILGMAAIKKANWIFDLKNSHWAASELP